MNKKQYHTTLGAVVSFSFFIIFIFYLYFDAKYKRDKQVFVEINQIKDSVIKIEQIS